jgi:16S rRNA (guanine(966)-N(2))-methyltransferase RsmD
VGRIVGGSVGGRRLVVPRGRGTRPTSDRVREGLFSALGGELTGRSFLDLYAGSGAVGLEAASRGAAPVVLVERDPAALTALRSNADALALPQVRVRAESVSRFLDEDVTAFDVVFLDPPYADPLETVLAALVERGWVAPGGTVVAERATRDGAPPWPQPLVSDRSRRYGDTTLWYGRRP